MADLTDFVTDFLDDHIVPLGSLQAHDYTKPQVLFYGTIPEERSDVHVIVEPSEFGNEEGFVEHLEAIVETVENGLSIRLLDDHGELTWDQLRLIDHMYGIMVQQEAAEKDVEEVGYNLNLGLITVETSLPTLSDCQFLGNEVATEVISTAKQIMKVQFQSRLMDSIDDLERGVRLLMPTPNLHIIDRDAGEGTKPFHNFDMFFGGAVGWYRLECIAKNLNPDAKLPMLDFRHRSRQFIDDLMKGTRAAIRMFNTLMPNEVEERVYQIIERTEREYEIETESED